MVLEDNVEGYETNKGAVALLKKLKAWNNIKKVCASEQMSAGKGQSETPRGVHGSGPCIIYHGDDGIEALRNIPGSLILLSL